MRENVGGGLYGPKYKRAGGKALDFYANTVLWLTTLDRIEKKDRAIGVVINAETKKSKTPRPFRECMFSILFDYGIDNVGSNIDFLFSLRGKKGELSKKNEKGIPWEGTEFNRDQLISFIEENRQKKQLKQMVMDRWEEIEDAIKVDRHGKYEDD